MADTAIIGRLVYLITGDKTGLDKSVSTSLKTLEAAAQRMRRIGGQMTKFITLPILGIGTAFVKAASDAEETRSKFNAVFKDQADIVREWAEEYSRSVGRAAIDNIGFLATLQDTFVPLGFARDRAAELSKSLVTLATDLASFNNLRTADVVRDLQSALVGNTETLRKYGVVATQAAIVQEALTSGLIESAGELDAIAKAQAIYQLTIKSTTDAQGDAERTADSFANQLVALQASFTDLRTEMGELLIPVVSDLVGWIRAAIERFNELDDETKRAILLIGGFAATVGPALIILSKLVTAFMTIRRAVIAARIAWAAFNSTVRLSIIGAMATVVGLVVQGITRWISKTREQREAQKRLNTKVEEAKDAMDDYRVSIDDVERSLGLTDEQLRLLALGFEKTELEKKIQALAAEGKLFTEEGIALQRQLRALKEEQQRLIETMNRQGRASRDQRDDAEDDRDAIDDLTDSTQRYEAAIEAARLKRKEFYVQQLPQVNQAIYRINQEKKAFIQAGIDKVEAERWAQGEIEGIWEQHHNHQRQLRFQEIEEQLSTAQQLVSQVAAISSQITANRTQQLENEYQTRRSYIEANLSDEEERSEALAELDSEFAERRKKLARQEAVRNKLIAVTESIINTAVGVTKALSQLRFGLATAIGILGAAQTALILAQPIPKAATGAEFVTRGRQFLEVGENPGGEELVQVTPMSSPNMRGPDDGVPIENNIHIGEEVLFRVVSRGLRKRRVLVPNGSVVP